MKKFLLLCFSIIFLLIFSACNQSVNTNELQTNLMQNLKSSEIDPTSVHNKIADGSDFYLIDVRTPEENADSSIKNSILMPLDKLENEILSNKKIKFEDEIILYCRSGNRSGQAYDILRNLGYINIKSMGGGINEWESLGFETCGLNNNNC